MHPASASISIYVRQDTSNAWPALKAPVEAFEVAPQASLAFKNRQKSTRPVNYYVMTPPRHYGRERASEGGWGQGGREKERARVRKGETRGELEAELLEKVCEDVIQAHAQLQPIDILGYCPRV